MELFDKLFSENEKTDKKQEASKETLEELVQASLDFLIKKKDGETPAATFPIPGTRNIARLYFGPVDKRKDARWHYTVGVYKKGTNMLVSHYLKSGTKEEVYEYIKTEENKNQTITSVKELSEDVDERWS